MITRVNRGAPVRGETHRHKTYDKRAHLSNARPLPKKKCKKENRRASFNELQSMLTARVVSSTRNICFTQSIHLYRHHLFIHCQWCRPSSLYICSTFCVAKGQSYFLYPYEFSKTRVESVGRTFRVFTLCVPISTGENARAGINFTCHLPIGFRITREFFSSVSTICHNKIKPM